VSSPVPEPRRFVCAPTTSAPVQKW
jgi:hypothetical protein